MSDLENKVEACCEPAKTEPIQALPPKPVATQPRLGRIAGTTIGYALVGSTAPYSDYMMPLGAAVGFVASCYVEFGKKNVDLWTPGIAAFLGGAIGNAIGPHHAEAFFTYLGAACGTGAAVYKQYVDKKQ